MTESQDNLFEVAGKCVAVTGGGVLCGALAKALGRRGAKLAVLDVADKAAGAVCKQIESAGGLRT